MALIPQSADATTSQVEDAMSDLDRATTILHNNLNSLEERLKPFLVPHPATGEAGKDQAPMAIAAPLITQLGNQTGSVNSATDRISKLLQHLCS
ncbi:MAG: hypothetical protein J7556_15175 [Acidovorax sp.]|nr:hypothetical protein [Acidovorax sp.]